MDNVNRQVRLAARPSGLPSDENWDLAAVPTGRPGAGQVLVRTLYLSLDPAMRGWMRGGPGYLPPVGIGDVMRAWGAGQVVASGDPAIPEGAFVTGELGVQEYAVAGADAVRVVDPAVAPLPTHLGLLGVTGMTAYLGLHEIGRPRPGETVVVSAAAGAVGHLVGQLAKIHGCRTVGIAGGERKARFLVERLGFDAVVDRHGDDPAGRLREAAPDGVDVYFDNVGGPLLDTVLGQINRAARVVLCGAITQYNAAGLLPGPANWLRLLTHQARAEGFLVFTMADRYPAATEQLLRLRDEGRLTVVEDIVDGTVHDFPEVLLRLYRGDNTGKLILQVAKPE